MSTWLRVKKLGYSRYSTVYIYISNQSFLTLATASHAQLTLKALLTIADKYEIRTVSSLMEERLADKEVLEHDTFGVFVVARRWGFLEVARAAAQRLTLTKIERSPSSKDPQNLAGEDFFRLLRFIQERGDETKRVIRTYIVTWDDEENFGSTTCDAHSDRHALEFYERLANEVIKNFDRNPCLDFDELAAALYCAPDPPNTGFCEDIYSWPEQERLTIHCPLRPSFIVANLGSLAWKLETIREQYLNKAFHK